MKGKKQMGGPGEDTQKILIEEAKPPTDTVPRDVPVVADLEAHDFASEHSLGQK